jgi:acetyltransferase-like isoleucine patch superfamily enzyme
MNKELRKIIKRLPIDYIKFRSSLTNKVSFFEYLKFKFRKNKALYWPIHKTTDVTHPKNIFVGINSNPGTLGGCYIQGNGKIFIGDYVHFSRNIGVISGNHGLYNHYGAYDNKETVIGDYSWIGMNCVILPGVVLGIRTIVGAGSVVTQSFPDGYCVIAGNPAKLIKILDKEKFTKHDKFFKEKFYGFIPENKFEQFRNKYLQKIEFDFDVSKVTENPFYTKHDKI